MAITSSKDIGEGVAIIPNSGVVQAPFSGKVTMVFPTGHAIGLTSDEGVEILIHIGIDTVNYPEYFHPMVKENDRVERGDLLINFDLSQLKASKVNTVTPVIVLNKKGINIERSTGAINNLDKLYSI